MEMKTKLFITGLAFMALTTLAGAQNHGAGRGQQNTAGKGAAWVDSNNDGICDNIGARKADGFRGRGQGNPGNCNFQYQKQGKAQKDVRRGQGNNRNFTDTNQNGICDFRETPSQK
jgi:hypothetical protein